MRKLVTILLICLTCISICIPTFSEEIPSLSNTYNLHIYANEYSGSVMYIYKLGDVNETATKYTMYDEYIQMGLNGIPSGYTEKKENFKSLFTYINNKQIEPYATGTVGYDCIVDFDGLERGIYFICSDIRSFVLDWSTMPPKTENRRCAAFVVLPLVTTDGEIVEGPDLSVGMKDDTYENNITTLKVIKQWAGDDKSVRPKGISVDLLSNNAVYDTIILNEDNSWTYTWNNLNSNKTWEIRESEIPEGYKCSYQQDGNTVTITNYKGESPIPNTSLKIIKVWNDNDNEAGLRPDEVYITLLCNGEYEDEAILSGENDWEYTWTSLNESYDYDVVEGYVSDDYTCSITRAGNIITIENTLAGIELPDPEPDPPPIDTTRIVVNKVWNNDDETVRPDTVSIDLLRDGELYDTVKLSKLSNWRYSWDDLDVGYTWSVIESDIPKGYSVSYSKTDSEHITVTNTYSPDEGSEVIMPSTGGSLSKWVGLYSIFGVCIVLALVIYRRSNKCKL